MPGTGNGEARELSRHLCGMVAMMRHHGPLGPLPVSLRFASAAAQGEAEALLARLSEAIDAPGQALVQAQAMPAL